MKRSPEYSSSPRSSPLVTPKTEADSFSDAGDAYSPSPSPSPTKSKSKSKFQPKLKAGPSPNSAKRQRSTPSSVPAPIRGNWSAGWSPDKKEAVVERYFTLGVQKSNINDIAQEFNLTKAQLQNAIQAGHKNNLTDKAAKSVR